MVARGNRFVDFLFIANKCILLRCLLAVNGRKRCQYFSLNTFVNSYTIWEFTHYHRHQCCRHRQCRCQPRPPQLCEPAQPPLTGQWSTTTTTPRPCEPAHSRPLFHDHPATLREPMCPPFTGQRSTTTTTLRACSGLAFRG